MIHAREIASSPEELSDWIARTDDVRERLTQAGYGDAFSAGDLYPLFEGFLARATAATPTPASVRPGLPRRLSTRAIVVVVAVVAAVVVAGVFLL